MNAYVEDVEGGVLCAIAGSVTGVRDSDKVVGLHMPRQGNNVAYLCQLCRSREAHLAYGPDIGRPDASLTSMENRGRE